LIIKSNNTKINEKNSVIYLTFPVLEKYNFIKHGFSTRIGGVSQGKNYNSMNLSFTSCQENLKEKENVKENYKRICNALDIELESLIASAQDHGDFIRVVKKENKGIGIYKEKDMKSVDGLITDQPGITLVTYHADCVPVYFLEPKRQVIGLVHSGWKGTVKEIAKKMVGKMIDKFSCNVKKIICVIGPCISKCCFKTDEDVYQEFLKIKNLNSSKNIIKKDDKYIIDLKDINKNILINSGILKENIFISDLCTCCYKDLFFSHRALQTDKRGTMAAFFQLCL